MDGFSTDEAAMDTINLIRYFKNQGGRALLYGFSYGTYLSTRIINISEKKYPDLLDAVILDGVCGGKYCNFTKYDENQEVVALRFIDRCANDAFCSSKLGTCASEVLKNFDKAIKQNNKCTKTFDGLLKSVLVTAMAHSVMRLLIPAFIYRINRCSDDDVIAIPLMMKNALKAKEEDSKSGPVTLPFSQIINFNIGISELQGRFGSVNESKKFSEKCHLCGSQSSIYPYLFSLGFHAYNESKYRGVPVTKIPILLLNGDLDPQTGSEWAENFYYDLKETSPNSQLIKFPNVVHHVLGNSLMEDVVESDDTCGYQIAVQFFENPFTKLDTSCTEKLLGLPFSGYKYTRERITSDLYEGRGGKETKSSSSLARINK
ncbi:hypothetical protein AKO1_002925, partial [Acrasis kona]